MTTKLKLKYRKLINGILKACSVDFLSDDEMESIDSIVDFHFYEGMVIAERTATLLSDKSWEDELTQKYYRKIVDFLTESKII